MSEVPEVEFVTIPKSDYLNLLNQSEKLDCLDSGGVDNWDWHDDSLEGMRDAVDCNDKGLEIEWVEV